MLSDDTPISLCSTAYAASEGSARSWAEPDVRSSCFFGAAVADPLRSSDLLRSGRSLSDLRPVSGLLDATPEFFT